MKRSIKKIFDFFGIKIIAKKQLEYPKDMEPEFYDLYEKCKPYTMTSTERLYSVYKSIDYIVSNNIEGDIIECGVWKGGSSMMAALCLKKMGDVNRTIYLYDTYEGMALPSEKDVDYSNTSAKKIWLENKKDKYNDWCYSPIEEVKINLESTKYPIEKIKFIKGKVEDTIPKTLPNKIALLRLDTDWYESTYHELQHLYPLLNQNAVLIIDDYGYWKGSRDATDQYFKENNIKILLNRIDNTGRVGIKLNTK